MLERGQAAPLAALYGAKGGSRPWTWASLTRGQARELVALLDRFADHYNRTYVVDDRFLILGCWPLHPGLAHELAALYGTWVAAFDHPHPTAEAAAFWLDRWLPGFQHRLPGWYGVGSEVCRPGLHLDDWNPAAAKLTEAAHRPLSVDVDELVRGLIENPAHLDGTAE